MSTKEQVKNIILKHNGNANKQQIARELNMGLDYVNLICRDLERKGEIIYDGFSAAITSAKKIQGSIKSVEESVLLGIPKMTKELVSVLGRAGYKTIESLADAPIARLMSETKLKLPDAAKLINRARKVLNKIVSIIF